MQILFILQIKQLNNNQMELEVKCSYDNKQPLTPSLHNPFLKLCGIFPQYGCFAAVQRNQQILKNKIFTKKRLKSTRYILTTHSHRKLKSLTQKSQQKQRRVTEQNLVDRNKKDIFCTKLELPKRFQQKFLEINIRNTNFQNDLIMNSKQSTELNPQTQIMKQKKVYRCNKQQSSVTKKNIVRNQNKNILIQKKNQLPNINLQSNFYSKFQQNKPLLRYNKKQLNQVKAQSFIITQYPNNQIILSHNSKLSLQIASLTKIMTFYVTMKIVDQFKISITQQKIQIQSFIEEITGTVAQLIEGQIYTIQNLLYGLMLPSGNDAAICLAEWGGKLLSTKQNIKKQYIKIFVKQMNITAKQLGLMSTRYGNPHGLPHQYGCSTAYDISKLISISLKNNKFREVINTKQYITKIKTVQNIERIVKWQNTNKLLRRQGFIGVKTGVTITAGPCLATCYVFKNRTFIAVLLRANKISRRFKQTRKILYWTLSKLFLQLSVEQRLRLDQLKKNRRQFDSDYSQDQDEFTYGKLGKKQLNKRKKILRYEL